MRATSYCLSSRFCLVLVFGLLLPNIGCVIPSPNGWVLNRAGIRQYNRGHYAQARNRFSRALKYDPCNPDYRHNLAMALQKQGDATACEQILRHNLTVDAMHQPTYHSLAQLMVTQGRAPEAQELVSTWAATQPYVPEANIELAWLQRENGDTAGAEQSLQTALRAEPSNPVALSHLGQLYQSSGRPDQAVAYYQRSLAANWNQPEVQSRLATLVEPENMTRSAMMQNAASPAMLAGGPMMGDPQFASGPMMGDQMLANGPLMNDAMMANGTIFGNQMMAGVETMTPTPMMASSYPVATEANAVTLDDGMSVSESRRKRRIHRRDSNATMAMTGGTHLNAASTGWIPTPSTGTTDQMMVSQINMPPLPDSIASPYASRSNGPTPIAQFDPAHAADSNPDLASLPVVDPH